MVLARLLDSRAVPTDPGPRSHWTTTLPAGVRDLSARLESEGYEAWLVGESLMRLLVGRAPEAFEVATTAASERILDLFPRAIPTQSARGIVTVPTGSAPVDVSSLRSGCRLAEALARGEFTVLAMAYRPQTQTFLDPQAGCHDLEALHLRSVTDRSQCFTEDPVRMLRAARLVADYGFAPQPDLETAITAAADSCTRVVMPRLRSELARLLLGNHPAEGLGLLRRTGLEARIAPGTRPDSGALVATLPQDLVVRMAGWLRGTRTGPLLRQLRFGVERSRQVERLLAHHPLDARVNPRRDRVLSRLLGQVTPTHLEALFAMRNWELQHAEKETDVAEAHKQLSAVRSGIARIVQSRAQRRYRPSLALDGRAVMQLLGCKPGRQVGAALRFLTEWVDADPDRNEADTLRAALLEWKTQTTDTRKPRHDLPES